MKYFEKRFNPLKVGLVESTKEISQDEFYKLCESKDSYFLSHIENEKGEIEGHEVHIVDLLL